MSRIGQIVYWCNNSGNGVYNVKWGIVNDESPGITSVEFLEPMDTRLIDGVPINDFVSERKYRKLPDGWPDIELFKLSERPVVESQWDITDPKSIKNAYENGWLVRASTNFYGDIEADITKQGFRIVKRYSTLRKRPVSAAVFTSEIKDTYDEAQKEVDECIAKYQQNEMVKYE